MGKHTINCHFHVCLPEGISHFGVLHTCFLCPINYVSMFSPVFSSSSPYFPPFSPFFPRCSPYFPSFRLQFTGSPQRHGTQLSAAQHGAVALQPPGHRSSDENGQEEPAAEQTDDDLGAFDYY